MDNIGNEICKAKVTFVLHGYGWLSLTTNGLFWNKSATSLLAFGALNALTEDFVGLRLDEISKVGKYTYFPGGGLVVVTNQGRELKFAFKHKKDFNTIYDYLTKIVRERN